MSSLSKTRSEEIRDWFSLISAGNMCKEGVPHIPELTWNSHPALNYCKALVCKECRKIIDIRLGERSNGIGQR